MKNYYEILEVNKNASPEVVDKAYKVLVKKYHPDLQQTPQEKIKCEEMIKEINKAYETISNTELRAEYDRKLEAEYNEQMQYEKEQIIKQYAQNQNYTKTPGNFSQNSTPTYSQSEHPQQPSSSTEQRQYNEYQSTIEKIHQQFSDAINKAYNDAYIDDLKSRGYKIKYKKSYKDYLNSFIALLITVLIVILILQIPFVRNLLYEFYEDNQIIKYIVDTISSNLSK